MAAMITIMLMMVLVTAIETVSMTTMMISMITMMMIFFPPFSQVFEVEIEKMVDRWSGSIELGVTTIGPEDIHFPNTMTDIDYDTWMLSGSAVMQDGATIKNG